ncbi:MAG TPA: Crp/Fnr family transcriptional regulator [Terracidiphilus sp.]|nr:Crp/Fnr family transcriptional regulator [Terracidiphilus sp.]
MQVVHEGLHNTDNHAQDAKSVIGKFSPAAQKDLMSLATALSYPAGHVLFAEREAARGIYIVLEGAVKLSINSSDGRRLSLRIAQKGEILGLTSTISGNAYELTAETLYPAKIAPVGRREFLGFLARHPEAYQTVSEELTREFMLACEQLRTVGLASSAPEKLARLLLDWSAQGQAVDAGAKFRFPLTHEEIGEFIGASRETVTRTLTAFKNRRLVSFHGSMLTIPNKSALADYARC